MGNDGCSQSKHSTKLSYSPSGGNLSFKAGFRKRPPKGNGKKREQTRRFETMSPGIVPEYIYFIQAESGAIKIGYGKNPYARLRAFRTSSRERLELRAFRPGTKADEAALHRQFSQFRIRGEWFRPVKRVLNLVQNVRDEYGLPKEPDLPSPMTIDEMIENWNPNVERIPA